jgi:Fe-S-cluster containining protein
MIGARAVDATDQTRASVSLSLRVGGEQLDLTLEVPAGPARIDDLLPALQALVDALVRHAAARVERDGRSVSCRAGCGACCRQLVPVSEPEARRLAALVRGLPDRERDAVEARFARVLEALVPEGLLARLRAGDATDRDERRRIGLAYFARGLPCPFLVDESCSIHPDRPLACREYLVTSPAERCARPAPGQIDQVELPTRLSQALMRFRGGAEATAARWRPLVLVLETGPAVPAERSGPELLREFLTLALGD